MALIDVRPDVRWGRRTGAGEPAGALWGDGGSRGTRSGADRMGGRRSGPPASRGPRQRVAACARPRRTGEWGWLLLAGCFACLVVVLVGLFGSAAGRAPVQSRTVVVRVATGDTVWSLAQRFAPGEDPRSVARRIEELNSLDGADLRVGQPLAVPVGAG